MGSVTILKKVTLAHNYAHFDKLSAYNKHIIPIKSNA